MTKIGIFMTKTHNSIRDLVFKVIEGKNKILVIACEIIITYIVCQIAWHNAMNNLSNNSCLNFKYIDVLIMLIINVEVNDLISEYYKKETYATLPGLDLITLVPGIFLAVRGFNVAFTIIAMLVESILSLTKLFF